MIHRIGRIALPPVAPWVGPAAITAVVAFAVLVALVVKPPSLPYIKVAMIGNSMQYYNDLPRFLEAISDGRIEQNSCLHGDSNLHSILVMGSGMYQHWKSGSSRIAVNNTDSKIYDFGACTVPQLLFGYDEDLETRAAEIYDSGNDDSVEKSTDNDDFYSYYDSLNPCLRSEEYLTYLNSLYQERGPPQYDFIFINDNTRSPARNETRQLGLQTLEEKYLPWFLETGATPVFLMTHAYWSPYRDMGGLGDVATFTALTYEGYKQYADLLRTYLPKSQEPRIAPVGLAFLLVHEENYSFWERMFHTDFVHASPLGTFLQGLVVHHTLFGVMPRWDVAVRKDPSSLWRYARRFQPTDHRRNPFPTEEECAYLFHVAERVTKFGVIPKSLTRIENGEASDYVPQDDIYRVDDIF
jgi:hypothetical protein